MREKSPTPKPPKPAPDCDFNCFPPASPTADTMPGKQKAPRRALLKTLILLSTKLERAKRFELSTLTLARLCSTPELRPRSVSWGSDTKRWRVLQAENTRPCAKSCPKSRTKSGVTRQSGCAARRFRAVAVATRLRSTREYLGTREWDIGGQGCRYPNAYPAPRTVRSGSDPPFCISTLRRRPTCTSTVRVST